MDPKSIGVGVVSRKCQRRRWCWLVGWLVSWLVVVVGGCGGGGEQWAWHGCDASLFQQTSATFRRLRCYQIVRVHPFLRPPVAASGCSLLLGSQSFLFRLHLRLLLCGGLSFLHLNFFFSRLAVVVAVMSSVLGSFRGEVEGEGEGLAMV